MLNAECNNVELAGRIWIICSPMVARVMTIVAVRYSGSISERGSGFVMYMGAR